MKLSMVSKNKCPRLGSANSSNDQSSFSFYRPHSIDKTMQARKEVTLPVFFLQCVILIHTNLGAAYNRSNGINCLQIVMHMFHR